MFGYIIDIILYQYISFNQYTPVNFTLNAFINDDLTSDKNFLFQNFFYYRYFF